MDGTVEILDVYHRDSGDHRYVIALERQAEILAASLEKIEQEKKTNADTRSGILPSTRFGLEIEEIG